MDISPEILYPIGALLLLGALLWGVVQYHTRNRANDPITEKATRDLYDKPREEYDREREELKDELRPS